MARQAQHVEALTKLFRVLGDPTRLRLLLTLQEGERNVSELCRKLKTPQPTVSRHLGILRMGGLASARRDGKEMYYSIEQLALARYAAAMEAMLADGKMAALRMGPLVLGLAKN